MPPEQRKRVLIATRLSRVTDATTSPERQRKDCEDLVRARGWEIVGYAKDLDTSGAVSPFERAKLGRWLNHRASDFDVLVVSKLDRLTRSMLDLVKLIEWATSNGVQMVSATETHFDTSNEYGQTIALLISSFAQMELASIRERNRNAFKYNYSRGKWRGGVAPWGYVPERDDDGDWRLVPDPPQVKLIREIVGRVIDGEGLSRIVRDLDKRGEPTAKDAFSIAQGRAPRGFTWHVSPLRRALKSRTLLGYTMIDKTEDADGKMRTLGVPVSDDGVLRAEDGSPLVRSAPILDADTWDRLQAALIESARPSISRKPQALLTGVLFCGVCGAPMWILRGSKGRVDRYRCKSANTVSPCGNRSLVARDAEDNYISLLAPQMDQPRLERRWVTGDDPGVEIAEIDRQLDEIAQIIGSGEFRSGTRARATLNNRLATLSARREELDAIEVRVSGWEMVETGETLRDWWEQAGAEERNAWARKAGPRVWAWLAGRGAEMQGRVDFQPWLYTEEAMERERAEWYGALVRGETRVTRIEEIGGERMEATIRLTPVPWEEGNADDSDTTHKRR